MFGKEFDAKMLTSSPWHLASQLLTSALQERLAAEQLHRPLVKMG